MTPDQINLWVEIQNRHHPALERIANAVEQLLPSTTTAPNYQKPLEEFSTFDCKSIGATVERSDRYGAGVVSWRGQLYTRRSPDNKFGEAQSVFSLHWERRKW